MKAREWSLGVALLLALGCGTRTVALTSTDTTPAARGELKLKERDSGNTEIRMRVRHLAPPERIQSDASQYVVWVEPATGSAPPQNVGALPVSDDLEASIQTVTPLDKFNLFVTPEATGRATQPTGPRVLWASVR